MYGHGVGLGIGGVDTHDRRVREIVYGAHAVVVVADYDRSPERQSPVATWKTCLRWLKRSSNRSPMP